MAGRRDAGPMAQGRPDGGGALSPALLQGYFLFAARRSALALELCIAWAKSRGWADDLLAKASLAADGGLGSLSPDELSRVGKPAETEFLAAQNRFESSLREAKRVAGLSEEQAKWLADIEEAVRDHRLAQKETDLIPRTEKRLAEVRASYGAAIVDALLKSTKELDGLDAAEARVRERCNNLLDD